VKSLILCLCILLLYSSAAPAFAQKDKEAKPGPWPAGKVNSALGFARMATAQQRYQESETLMLQVTQANPKQVLAWAELGNAQLGLKKYTEAENSFKIALGLKSDAGNPAPQASAASEPPAAPEAAAAPTPDKPQDLVLEYIRSLPVPGASKGGLSPLGGGSGSPPPPAAGSSSLPPPGGGSSPRISPAAANNALSNSPQVLGPVYASLGEVYAHEGKIPEAQAAFDQAVAALPGQAAQYRSNETIVFFQVGQGDAEYTAAKQALALDPERTSMYYFEGQALLASATIDPKTQKLTLTPECIDAFNKFLKISPNGHLNAEVRGILASAGVTPAK